MSYPTAYSETKNQKHMNTQIKFFSQARILQQIGHLRVAKFLDSFTGDLASENLAAPPVEPMTDDYFSQTADLLSNITALPKRLLQAMSALESAAAPENDAQLNTLIQRHIPNVSVSHLCALDRALEVWFTAPDEFTSFKVQSSTVQGSTVGPASSLSSFSSSSSSSTSDSESPSVPAVPPPTLDLRPQTFDSGQSSDSQTIHALAQLSPLEYDRARKGFARELGIRVETLDAEVARVRNQLHEDAMLQSALATLRSPEPWPEPVNGAEVLTQVADRFNHYLILPPGAPHAFTLWDAHAHCFSAFIQSPRLNISSPEGGCGKTTALDVIAALTPRAIRTENLTAPVLFRLVHQHQPTLLLDEVDAWLPQAEELRGLLNAGHKRGACAYRCDGEGNAVRPFRAFSPAVLAGIGQLTGTLHDRSIVVPLMKAEAGDKLARFDDHHIEIETELCRKLARWTADNFAAIKSCEPAMPPAAFNRLGDNWRPLFAIAQIAGGDWPRLALESFNHLATVRTPPPHPIPLPVQSSEFNSSTVQSSNGSQLISVIRHIFAGSGVDRLSSTQLAEALTAQQPSNPAIGQSNGQSRFTPVTLSRQLRQFGIKPKVLRFGDHLAKGYELSDFAPPEPRP
jgi:putative DNA primase/helicase